MKINERELVVKEKGLCIGCLHRGHIWRNCRQRKTCEICKKQHPSILHQFTVSSGNQQSLVPESIKSTSRSSKSTAETSCVSSIIPVWVEHDTKRVLTYALLDEQSDACFVSDEVKQKLGVKGPTLELEISTVLTTGKVKSERIEGLKVRGLNQEDVVNLPTAYSREYIPGSAEQIPTPDKLRNWPHLSQLQDQLSPLISMAVGLLIGANCPKVLTPRDVIPGIRDGDPYGIRTVLGWSVVGVINSQEGGKTTSLKSCRTSTKELIALLERDFIELDPPQDSALSIEEKKFLSYMEKGLEISHGHIQLPLPFKVKEPKMPNNRWVAERRLSQLRVKLQKDPELAEGYTAFMEKIIEENQAEMVPMNEILNDAWYLPHHNVKHPHKPDKVRVVLDGAAKCDGISLNDVLLKGPNMTNSLVGVLMRFREEPVAIVGDIEGMFYQVKVKPDHRDYLRFLWWEKGQLNQEPQVYRMTVHVFGAVSSPGCANYALKETARRFSKENDDVVKFVENGFYVDDGLISVSSTKKAIALIESTITTLKKGGFKLHKFLSNRPEVIAALPPDLVSTKIDALTDLSILPTERTLGILWNASTDQFEFKAHLDERPATRRGILATVSSIFDPLGFVGPYVLNGKRILQKTCVNGAAWDDQVDQTTQEEWSEWKRQLAFLDKLKIERCYKPTSDEQTEIVAAEIHHFSDASEQGYGQCSYLRLVDSDKRVQVSLLSSKCRVTPTKAVTMPRLELVAATLSSKMAAVIRRELKSKYDDIISEHFWSDSRVVLGRFHTFVANRVETIRSFSEPEQWHYISSGENPADIASRGKTAEELINSQLWWRGPPYLSQLTYTIENSSPEMITDDDVEVKGVKTCTTHIPVQLIPNMLKRYSSWSKAKRVLALCLIFIYKCRGWKRRGELMVSDIERAERIMIEVVQHNDGKLMEGLKSLNPMLDENGIIRVGGRLRNSLLAQELKHPIVLPRNSEVTRLVITHYHERTHHQGRGITLNTIRNAGFWIIGGTTTVGKFIRNCVNCRKLRRLPESQKMADLPADRLEPTPAFTNCGVDLFGPFIVKNGRKEEKRYGVLFTCLVSRAVHIEVANSLSTDSFINALRRMIARRGAVKVMRSDNGTNFIGASRELKEAINEMDISNIQSKLLDFNCQWIWNVPTASHHGGVWERMIRTTRSILNGLMMEHRAQLNDEMLCTFMTEAEGIVNSRPLYTTNDISLEPLTPALLLTMRICIPPPPGNFNRHGKYSRKLWRRVQHLADTFWSRWRKEYIHTLQERQKWTGKTRNMKRDDIVLVMNNNLPRNQWELARVTEVMASQDNMVRKVKLFCGRGKIELERPVTKLVLLVPAEEEHKNEC